MSDKHDKAEETRTGLAANCPTLFVRITYFNVQKCRLTPSDQAVTRLSSGYMWNLKKSFCNYVTSTHVWSRNKKFQTLTSFAAHAKLVILCDVWNKKKVFKKFCDLHRTLWLAATAVFRENLFDMFEWNFLLFFTVACVQFYDGRTKTEKYFFIFLV